MGRRIDIGGYFEKLTRRGEGGRRLDTDSTRGSGHGTSHDRDLPGTPARHGTPRRRSSGTGSLRDILRDALGTGRETAQRTATKAKAATKTAQQKARQRRRARLPLPPEGVVTIEYAPRMDGDPDPGDVVWTWVPFEEDPEQGKDRPVVVIGRRGRTLVGVPLTTKRDDREAQIAIGTGDWDPKRRQSYARIWRMLDVDEERMRREGAVLARGRFDDVVAAVERYYDVHHPSPRPSGRSAGDDDFDFEY